MTNEKERDALRSEVEALLRQHGIDPRPSVSSGLSREDCLRVYELAAQIINGDFNQPRLSGLSPQLKEELSRVLQEMMMLRGNRRLRELQEKNPYYSAFGSAIVRDGASVRPKGTPDSSTTNKSVPPKRKRKLSQGKRKKAEG